MTEIVASLGVGGRPRCCLLQRDVQAAGPPPSLRSATSVLAATRGKGVDRMPTQVAGCPRNALQNEGRGMSRLAKDRQPRVCRGADWAPHAAWLFAGNVTVRASLIQTRSGRRSNRRSCVLCDSSLLESRSPRRDASTDGKSRRPGCPKWEPQVHTAVVDGPITQFRPRRQSPENDERNKARELSPREGDAARRQGRKRT